MSKIFFHDDGTPSPHPTSQSMAQRLKKLKYDDQTVCPTCRSCSIKYTTNSRCIHCARLEAIDFYNTVVLTKPWPEDRPISDETQKVGLSRQLPSTPEQAAKTKSPIWVRLEPCSKAGHVGIRTLTGECYLCESTRTKPARIAARSAGEKWYTPDDDCPDCGQRARRRVHDDKCSACHPAAPSPRQAAIAAGERWYKPAAPCPRCHTTALRHVDNGRCQGCRPPAGQQTSATAQLMGEQPDMVIDRQTARAMGLTAYRTGKSCCRRHTGWRYVSTGGCMDCLK